MRTGCRAARILAAALLFSFLFCVRPAAADLPPLTNWQERIPTRNSLQMHPREGIMTVEVPPDVRVVGDDGVQHSILAGYANTRHEIRGIDGFSPRFLYGVLGEPQVMAVHSPSGLFVVAGPSHYRKLTSTGWGPVLQYQTNTFNVTGSTYTRDLYSPLDVAIDGSGTPHVLVIHEQTFGPSSNENQVDGGFREMLYGPDFSGFVPIPGSNTPVGPADSYGQFGGIGGSIQIRPNGEIYAVWSEGTTLAPTAFKVAQIGGATVTIATGVMGGGGKMDAAGELHLAWRRAVGADPLRYRRFFAGAEEAVPLLEEIEVPRVNLDAANRPTVLDFFNQGRKVRKYRNPNLQATGGWAEGLEVLHRIREHNLGPSVGGVVPVGMGGVPGLSVNVANGNLVLSLPLFEDRGRGIGARFALTYNSLGSDDVGPLGRGWTHSYEWLLTKSDVGAVIHSPEHWQEIRFPDGRRVHYYGGQRGGGPAHSGQPFLPPELLKPAAESGESSWIDNETVGAFLHLADGTRVAFNGSGKPTEIRDTQLVPNTLALAYGENPDSDLSETAFGIPESVLTAITDSVGRVTELAYDAGNRLSEVARASGDRYIFSYDPRGRLAEILYLPVQALPHAIRWQFGYWDATDPATGGYVHLLKTIRTPRGNAGGYDVATVYYTPDRAVTRVQLAGDTYVNEGGTPVAASPAWDFSCEHPDFDANPAAVPLTTVTDPRGNDIVYAYQHRRSLVTRKTYPDPNFPPGTVFEEWTYNNDAGFPGFRNPLSFRDRRGNSTMFTFFPPVATPTPTQPYAVDLPETVLRPGQANPASWTYGVFNRVASTTDSLGNTTTYDLDDDTPGQETGNILSITHPVADAVQPDGSVIPQTAVESFTYLADGSGRVETRTSPRGGVTTYGYAGSPTGLATSVLRPDHAVPETMAYDLLGNLTETTPPGRGTTVRVLDGLYRVKEIREPTVDGQPSVTVNGYDPDGNLVSVQDPRGNVTTCAYNTANLRTAVTQPGGAASAATAYDVAGNVRISTDFRTNATTFTYDALNRLLKRTVPGAPSPASVTLYGEEVGGQVLNGYDANGNPVLMTEEGGADPDRVTRYAYDARNNRTRVIHATGSPVPSAVRSAFDDNDRLESAVLHEGVDTQSGDGGVFKNGMAYTYDARNRRDSSTQLTSLSAGYTTILRYDADSNQALAQAPATTGPSQSGVRSWTLFDLAGRPVDTLADDRRIVRHTVYTEDDLVDEVWVPHPSQLAPLTTFSAGTFTRVQKSVYDDQQRLRQAIDADGHAVLTDYDAADNVVKVTDRRGFTTERLSFDALNRPHLVREQTNPGTFLDTGYDYDADSRVTQTVDPMTGVTLQAYDAAGRLMRTEYPDTGGGPRKEEWTYTPFGETDLHRTFGPGGALMKTRDLAYDTQGRPTEELVTGTSGTLNRVVRTWDVAGNLTSTEDQMTGARTVHGIESGGNITGGYDALNRPILAQYLQGGVFLKALGTAWDEASRKKEVSGTDGERTRYAWDANGLLFQTFFKLPSGGEILQQTRTFDAALREKTVLDNASGILTTRTYDARTLLARIQTQQGAAPISNIVYARDLDGNVSSKATVASGETSNVFYAHDGAGRLTGESWSGGVPYAAAYGFDGNGNRTAKKTVSTYTVTQQAGKAIQVTHAYQAEATAALFDAENRLTGSLISRTTYTKITPTGTTVSSTEPGFSQAAITNGNANDTYSQTQTWASLDQTGGHTATLDFPSVQPVGQVLCWLPTTHGLFQRFRINFWNGSAFLPLPQPMVVGAADAGGGWFTNLQHEVAFTCFSVSTDKIQFEMDSGGGAPGRPNQAALNELQAFTPQTAITHAYTNAYDDAGNRLMRVDSATSVTETHSYDGFNRYVGYARTGGSNPTSVGYLLTPEGDRLARLPASGANTWFINDGSDVMTDYTGSPGSLLPGLFYVNGLGIDDKRVRLTLGGVRHLYNTDQLGTPIQVLDNAGSVAKSLRLNAWGEPVPLGASPPGPPNPVTDRYDYAQYEKNPESGLDVAGIRVYDPSEAVFYHRDPAYSDLGTGRSTYAYVGNNPTDYVDPFGEARWGKMFGGDRFDSLEAEERWEHAYVHFYNFIPLFGNFVEKVTFRPAGELVAAAEDFSVRQRWGTLLDVQASTRGLGPHVALAAQGAGAFLNFLKMNAVVQAVKIAPKLAVPTPENLPRLVTGAKEVLVGEMGGVTFTLEKVSEKSVAVRVLPRTEKGTLRITEKGLVRIEAHLDEVLKNQLPEFSRADQLRLQAGERAMLDRLRLGATTRQDVEFYFHELKESARFGATGDLMGSHRAALQSRGVTFLDLFHPEIMRAHPELFPLGR